MKIGFDFDGVIADCGKLKSDGAKKLYGIDIPPEKFKKELVLRDKHLTTEQYRQFQKTIYETREIGFLMEPVEDALIYIPRLIADGHTISIVTSRDGAALDIAQEWSVRQGLQLDFVGVGYGNSKAEAAAGLDVYADDDLDKLRQLISVVPNLFLFSWGYNAHLDAGTTAKRVASWEELYRAIQGL